MLIKKTACKLVMTVQNLHFIDIFSGVEPKQESIQEIEDILVSPPISIDHVTGEIKTSKFMQDDGEDDDDDAELLSWNFMPKKLQPLECYRQIFNETKRVCSYQLQYINQLEDLLKKNDLKLPDFHFDPHKIDLLLSDDRYFLFASKSKSEEENIQHQPSQKVETKPVKAKTRDVKKSPNLATLVSMTKRTATNCSLNAKGQNKKLKNF